MRLNELQPLEYKILEGKKRDGVLMTLEGIVQRADTKNANNRVYPRELWNSLMADEELNERIVSRGMFGELDHPASGATSGHRVSHLVTDHKLLPNGEVRGTIEILDTPAGRIAETIFRAGARLGVSSRGDGSIERKGDVSEVQNDFRLETYDLVLKPSTPGAYPSIIESEEAAKENVELIANAVEGLVKQTKDVKVLLECHKILSVLEGCESRCEAVVDAIKNGLGGSDSSSPDKSDTAKQEETLMQTNSQVTPPSPQLSPEVAYFLKEQVDRGIAEAVKEKDDKIAELNQRVVDVTTERDDSNKRLDAAEQLIEEFKRQLEDLKEGKKQGTESQKRYEAAEKIIDEMASRLQSMGVIERELAAAKALLSTSIERHREEAVDRAVDAQLEDVDPTVAEKLRPLLSECATADAVAARYEELSSLVETCGPARSKSTEREPLPTSDRLNEGTVRAPKAQSDSIQEIYTKTLLSRLCGVHG